MSPVFFLLYVIGTVWGVTTFGAAPSYTRSVSAVMLSEKSRARLFGELCDTPMQSKIDGSVLKSPTVKSVNVTFAENVASSASGPVTMTSVIMIGDGGVSAAGPPPPRRR